MSSVLPPDVPTPVEAPVGVGETYTTTAEPSHGPEESGGLPQFEFQHWGGQIIYLLFLFAILYLLIAKVFAPRMRRIFDERATTIATAIETARQVQAEAAGQAEAAKREVEEARAGARATAAAAKARVTDEANRRAAAEEAVVSARIAEAETAIGKTRDAAMTNVSTIAADTAAAIVERLTGVGVTDAEAAAAVKGV
jgi:F-type H+-transporting ATPase subunit b